MPDPTAILAIVRDAIAIPTLASLATFAILAIVYGLSGLLRKV
jgi:hypothetical protein